MLPAQVRGQDERRPLLLHPSASAAASTMPGSSVRSVVGGRVREHADSLRGSFEEEEDVEMGRAGSDASLSTRRSSGGGPPPEDAGPPTAAQVRVNALRDPFFMRVIRASVVGALVLAPQVLAAIVCLLAFPTEDYVSPETGGVSLRTWIVLDAVLKGGMIALACFPALARSRFAEPSDFENGVSVDEDGSPIVTPVNPTASPRAREASEAQALRARKRRMWRAAGVWLDFFTIVWVVQGSNLLAQQGPSHSWHEAPHLFPLASALVTMSVIYLCLPVIACLLVLPIVCFCLPCFLRALLVARRAGRPQGASAQKIATLPVLVYQTGMLASSEGEEPATAGSAAPTCAICLNAYENGVSKLHLLPCDPRHHFHAECVDDWLRLNATCPVCRKKVFEQEPAEREPGRGAGEEASNDALPPPSTSSALLAP